MALLRDLLKQIPGFAGGNLGDQLNRQRPAGLDPSTGAIWEAPRPSDGQWDVNGGRRGGAALGQPPPTPMRALLQQGMTPEPNPQMLTPANQAAITRPRTVTEPDPHAPFGSSGEPFGGTRDRRTSMRDFVADDSAYLRDLEAQPRNWKDKTVDVVRGLNQHFNPGSGPGAPTKRERNIETARGTLGRDLAVEKQQTDAALKSMVPVTLDDGTVVMAPARGAGTLRSQQQRIGQTGQGLDIRGKEQTSKEARRKAQTAIQIYNSGGANDPRTLAQLSKDLDLPADLAAKFNAGEVIPQVDADGKLQLIDKRTGKPTDTGVTSYETTKEKGRFERQERSANAAMARTQALIRAGIGKLGDPTVTEAAATDLEDEIQANLEDAERKTNEGFPTAAAKSADRAEKLRKMQLDLKEAANKARTAQGITGAGTTAKPKGVWNPKRFSEAFKTKNGRLPTQAEIDAYAAAANQ